MKQIYIVVLFLILNIPCHAQGTIASDPYFVNTTDTFSINGPGNITRNIIEDNNGTIWFASWEGIISYDGKLFTNHTLKEGLIKFHVFSMLEDRNGNIWFGTIGGGVYRYNGKTFQLFSMAEGLSSNLTMCMMEDKAGNIWFGTDAGACRYDGKMFTNFTTNHGLANNHVYTMAQDKFGKIWFGTESGISCYDPSASSWMGGTNFTSFKNDKGLPFNNVRSIVEDTSGKIWIGSQDGLYGYDGKAITKYNNIFTGNIFVDRIGNLWLSGGEVGGMSLSKYDGTSFTKIITNNNQIFGVAEDTFGNIWFGTAVGATCYNGKAFNSFSKENQ